MMRSGATNLLEFSALRKALPNLRSDLKKVTEHDVMGELPEGNARASFQLEKLHRSPNGWIPAVAG
jgi:hypothetical protein